MSALSRAAMGRVVGRRWVVRQVGVGGVLGFAVLTLAACSDGPSAQPGSTADSTTGSGAKGSSSGLAWNRVDLGFVSAYVLVRGNEAAIVDTGVANSEGDIEVVLHDAGLGWSDVGHVVLTHKHQDHAGSVGAVLEAATKATGYVGAADLQEVRSSRDVQPLGDGDEVFGLQVVATPGHTPGHLAVFDPSTGLLLAGDALNTGSGLAGASPQYSEDMAAAAESVKKLAELKPRTILVGHGPPLTENAAAALQQLAASM